LTSSLSKWYIKRVTKKKLSASHLFGQCAGSVDKKELHFAFKRIFLSAFFMPLSCRFGQGEIGGKERLAGKIL